MSIRRASALPILVSVRELVVRCYVHGYGQGIISNSGVTGRR